MIINFFVRSFFEDLFTILFAWICILFSNEKPMSIDIPNAQVFQLVVRLRGLLLLPELELIFEKDCTIFQMREHLA